MRETQKAERLGFPEAPLSASARSVTPELDQSGLLGMQFQPESRQSPGEITPEGHSISMVLGPDHEVVRVSHDGHKTTGARPSPAPGPEVQDMVQIQV